MYSSDVQWRYVDIALQCCLLSVRPHFYSSEGAQVGNIASAFGIVGVWTTALHDQGLFVCMLFDNSRLI